MRLVIIGLTGGIGSGKSTVSALFERLGVPVIDADVIARRVTEPNEPAFIAIKAHFGESIIRDRQLDRKALRNIIFQNMRERKWLEQLLHPLIEQEMVKEISTVQAPYCILSIPLLLEVTPYSFIDRVLVVDVPETVQIQRVMMRDQLSHDAARNIMLTQVSRETRLAGADDVIHNDAGVAELEKAVLGLHKKYMQLALSL